MTTPKLTFIVVPHGAKLPNPLAKTTGYLISDAWDDWRKYCTQFFLIFSDDAGSRRDIGNLKIGRRGLKPHPRGTDVPAGHRRPEPPKNFMSLPEDYFSLGQEEEYYENLSELGEVLREQFLSSLRDVARDQSIWAEFEQEDVMSESLLRYISRSTVVGQFRRMARGDAKLTPYSFKYTSPRRQNSEQPPLDLSFEVNPKSILPTNVHVLIGRNGVGKTRILSSMTRSLVAKDATARQSGRFQLQEDNEENSSFANLVAVSFSAFDEGEYMPDRSAAHDTMGFAFIGLRSEPKPGTKTPHPKTPHRLATEFVKSLQSCRASFRSRRWKEVISILESDPVFKAADLSRLIDANLDSDTDKKETLSTFKRLSSGHKIVLLTLSRLVEKVEERTLVLIDEPECHLHPPLLSAMTRAISDLMVKRNGVAIIATHSPIVLQEVPASCVWILDRTASASQADRPEEETFSESVGILSRSVFRLELSQSGYHRVLSDIKNRFDTYEEAIGHLQGRLGGEGKAVLHSMYLYESSMDTPES